MRHPAEKSILRVFESDSSMFCLLPISVFGSIHLMLGPTKSRDFVTGHGSFTKKEASEMSSTEDKKRKRTRKRSKSQPSVEGMNLHALETCTK